MWEGEWKKRAYKTGAIMQLLLFALKKINLKEILTLSFQNENLMIRIINEVSRHKILVLEYWSYTLSLV